MNIPAWWGFNRMLNVARARIAPWARAALLNERAWWARMFPWQKRPEPQFSPLPPTPEPTQETPPAPAPPLPTEQPLQQDYTVDWRKYFPDIYEQLRKREQPPVVELPMPQQPRETDWGKLASLLLGLMSTSPEAVRAGVVKGVVSELLRQQQEREAYVRALAERAYRMAEAERQRQIAQEQADAQAREAALRMAQAMATDEERRALQAQLQAERSALQAQLEALRNARQLEAAKINADMQAVSRHMAIANNPQLPKEQRAAAYQNAAAILSQYGYELPALPAAPSVAERAQQLREQIEPQKLELARQEFDLKKWAEQNRIRQGWERIRQMQQNISLAAARLAQSVQTQNQKMAQDSIKNLSVYHNQLAKEEDSLVQQLNAHTRDELGRPVPVFNIPLARQEQLRAGALPTTPIEAQWQDLTLRLQAVRRERERASQLLRNLILPPVTPTPRANPQPTFRTRSGNTFTP